MADTKTPPNGARLLPMTGQENAFILYSYLTKQTFDDSWHNYRDFSRVVSTGSLSTATDGKKWLKVIGYNGDSAVFTGFIFYDDRNTVWFDVPTATVEVPGQIPLFAAIASGTSVNLTWDNPEAVSVQLDRSEADVGPFTGLVRLPATIKSYADKNLKAGTTYYYRISGLSTAGAGPYSEVVNALTDGVAATGGAASTGSSTPTPAPMVDLTTHAAVAAVMANAAAAQPQQPAQSWLQKNETVLIVVGFVVIVLLIGGLVLRKK